jgi:simple sugar transport system substrate-binding protein
VNIVQLEGTTGSAPAIDRAEGFADVIRQNSNLKVVASQTGDFTRAGGKQVMEAMLKSQPQIDLVYAHNDDMGLGAIEAIEAAGKVPGKDIKIVTVDAVHDGMVALSEGKINFIVECSPLLGKQLVDIIKTLNDGGSVEPRIVTEETTFNQEQAKEALPNRQY